MMSIKKHQYQSISLQSPVTTTSRVLIILWVLSVLGAQHLYQHQWIFLPQKFRLLTFKNTLLYKQSFTGKAGPKWNPINPTSCIRRGTNVTIDQWVHKFVFFFRTSLQLVIIWLVIFAKRLVMRSWIKLHTGITGMWQAIGKFPKFPSLPSEQLFQGGKKTDWIPTKTRHT